MSIATEAVMKQEVYQVNGMNLWYGQHHALRNINLSIYENEVTAIIGPSGCGKSTFIKTLNLMIQMTPNVKLAGELNYNGSNILKDKVDIVDLRKISAWSSKKGIRFRNLFLIMWLTDRESTAPKIRRSFRKLWKSH